MREIKFRAWTGIKMEYNVMAGFLGAFYVPGIDSEDSACMSQFNTIYAEQTPIMQYTGLKDKNGKEIYQSDLVIWDGGQYEVVFSDIEGAWILKDDREDWECPSLFAVSSPKQSRIEVISNKYEQKVQNNN